MFVHLLEDQRKAWPKNDLPNMTSMCQFWSYPEPLARFLLYSRNHDFPRFPVSSINTPRSGFNPMELKSWGPNPCSSHQETIGPVKRKPCCAITAKVANKTLFLTKVQKWNRPRDCRCSCDENNCLLFFSYPVWPSPSIANSWFPTNDLTQIGWWLLLGGGHTESIPICAAWGLESLPTSTYWSWVKNPILWNVWYCLLKIV